MNWPSRQAPEYRIARAPFVVPVLLFTGLAFAALPAIAHGAGRLWTETPPASAAAHVTMPDFIDLAATLSPAVVNIAVEQDPAPTGDDQPPGGGDFLGPPDGGGGTGPAHGLGSGFIINQSGYILTNNHVVSGARKINVTTHDGHRYTGRLVGTDPRSDVALVKIDPVTPLRVAPLGSSRDLRVGAWVMAIGNPFGFDHSVTVGIVSAKGRFIPGSYDEFIQTDASINPGNSGGPLIDATGRVIGVTSAIYTRTGSNTGISFAIPIDMVKQELPELADGHKVVRGWIGVYLAEVTPQVADAHGLDGPRGALIDQVIGGGPAEKAGLKSGDLIVSYDGRSIAESQNLPMMVGDSPIGHIAALGIIRGGHTILLRVKVESLPQGALASIPNPVSQSPLGLGLVVRGMEGSKAGGVIIDSIVPGSPAANAGLQVKDIILEVNRQPVVDSNSFQKALGTGGKDGALLLVRRGKATVFIPVSPAG